MMDLGFVFFDPNVLSAVASGGGTPGRFPPPPPPEIGRIVVEIWCYRPEKYTLADESEFQEIFRKKCGKSPFSIEILIKKSEWFLEIFQNFLRFWSILAQVS